MTYAAGDFVRVVYPGLDANHPHHRDLPTGTAGEVTSAFESNHEPCVNLEVTGIDPILNKTVTQEYFRIPERCLTKARP